MVWSHASTVALSSAVSEPKSASHLLVSSSICLISWRRSSTFAAQRAASEHAVVGALQPCGSDAAMPGWEAVLLQCSFVGTGIALAIALPAYLWRRWPHALRQPERPRTRTSSGAVWPAVTGAATGLVWLYRAAGGPLGIAHRDERPASWHVLVGVSAGWALVGSAAVLALVRRRSARLPYPLLLALAWLGSGSMFAWSGWRLPATVYVALAHPSDVSYPENIAVAVALHVTAVLTGAGIMRTLVRGERRRVSMPDSAKQSAERVGRRPWTCLFRKAFHQEHLDGPVARPAVTSTLVNITRPWIWVPPKGLPHDRVTSELACPVGRVGRMSLCPSLIRKSSVRMSCGSRETAARA
ncbi:hypothetical protein ACWEBX_40590 [Streptomyces sp. NPDC005070]